MNEMALRKFGVIFDCDGTLVDSLGEAMESFNYALRKVDQKLREPEEIKRHFGAAADRIFIKILRDEKLGLQAFEHYLDHQSELALRTQMHRGVQNLLEQLREKKIPMAIVTGRHARDLDLVLKPHGIAHEFTALIADSQLPQSKPAPDGLLLAAQIMGLDPRNTVYIGDSPTDIQAAHAAGAKSIAALWDSLANTEQMKAENPDGLAQTPSEIWNLLETLFLETPI